MLSAQTRTRTVEQTASVADQGPDNEGGRLGSDERFGSRASGDGDDGGHRGRWRGDSGSLGPVSGRGRRDWGLVLAMTLSV